MPDESFGSAGTCRQLASAFRLAFADHYFYHDGIHDFIGLDGCQRVGGPQNSEESRPSMARKIQQLLVFRIGQARYQLDY